MMFNNVVAYCAIVKIAHKTFPLALRLCMCVFFPLFPVPGIRFASSSFSYDSIADASVQTTCHQWIRIDNFASVNGERFCAIAHCACVRDSSQYPHPDDNEEIC